MFTHVRAVDKSARGHVLGGLLSKRSKRFNDVTKSAEAKPAPIRFSVFGFDSSGRT